MSSLPVAQPGIRAKYQALPTAAKFHASRALFRGLMGPIGSGKSVASCWELFRLACLQAPFDNVRRSRWGVIRQTYPELKSTTIKTWLDWFPPSLCSMNYEFPIRGNIRIPLKDGTLLDMELLFVAVEREDDIKKLLSLDLTGVWINEAREVVFGVVKALQGRIGRYPGKRQGGHSRKCVIADTNPPSEEHWWYRLAEEGRLSEDAQPVTKEGFEFFRQPPAVLKTLNGYVINPAAENIENLTDGERYYLDQLAGKDHEWIKVYLMGDYGVIQSGKPVYGSLYNDQLHVSPVPFTPVKGWPTILSFDFGLTPAAVFAQVTPRGIVRILDEVVGDGSGIGLRQLCQNVVKPLLLTRYAGCAIYVTGDPAGRARSGNDETTSYEVLAEEIGPYVLDIGEASTNGLEARLDAVRLFLSRLVDGRAAFQLSPDCKLLRRGFLGAYKFAQVQVIASGSVPRLKDTPEKNIYSHPHDAVQYLCMRLREGLPRTTTNAARGTRHEVADAVAGY